MTEKKQKGAPTGRSSGRKVNNVVVTMTVGGAHPCRDTPAARYQEARLGRGKRLGNGTASGARCTVCGYEDGGT